MYEELNYAELDEMRDRMLLSCVGKSYDDPNFEVNRMLIESISAEMESREAIAKRRMLKCVMAVNVLALAVILLCTGCEAFGGLGRDLTWTAEAGQEMLRNGHRVGK